MDDTNQANVDLMNKVLKRMFDRDLLAVQAEEPESDFGIACANELRERMERGWLVADDEFPLVSKPQADSVRQRATSGFYLLNYVRGPGLRQVKADVAVTDITPTETYGLMDYTITFTYRGKMCVRPYFDQPESQPPTEPVPPLE